MGSRAGAKVILGSAAAETQVGPGYVDAFDFLNGGVGSSDNLNQAITEGLGGVTGPGGVLDLSFGISNITFDSPLVLPSDTVLKLAGPINTKFIAESGYNGDLIMSASAGQPFLGDQYILITGGATITGSAPGGKVNVQRGIYIGGAANIAVPGTVQVYGDLNPVNYAGAPTGFLAGGGYFYAAGTIYSYTGVAGATATGPPPAGSPTTPYPEATLLGVAVASGGGGSLKANTTLFPYTAGANAIGAGIRLVGFRMQITGPGLYVITQTWGDAYGLWAGLSGHANSCYVDSLVCGSGGGYGYINYGVADSYWRDLNTNGMGLGGVALYGADQIGRTLHATNGPTNSAFTPGLTSFGEKHQRAVACSFDGCLAGGVVIDNGRHAATPTEVFKMIECADLIGNNFNVIAGFAPFLSMAAIGNNSFISDIDVIGCITEQARCAQGSSGPCGALINTFSSGTATDVYFVDLLTFIISADTSGNPAAGTFPNITLSDTTGAVRNFNALTAIQCALAIGTVKTGGTAGVGPQGTTGVITLTSPADAYGFFNAFQAGKNVVVPDPSTAAPIFLNDIAITTVGGAQVLTGTWGPNTVAVDTTKNYPGGGGACVVSQCYASGMTMIGSHTFTGITNIASIAAGATTVITATGHGLAVGDVINVVGVQGTMAATINGTWTVVGVTTNTITLNVVTTGLVATAAIGSVGPACYPIPGAFATGTLYAQPALAAWTIGTQINYIPATTDVHWTAWRGATTPSPQFNVQAPVQNDAVFTAGSTFTVASTAGLIVGQKVNDATTPGNLAPGTVIGNINFVTNTITLLPGPLAASAVSPGDLLECYGDMWTWDTVTSVTPPVPR